MGSNGIVSLDTHHGFVYLSYAESSGSETESDETLVIVGNGPERTMRFSNKLKFEFFTDYYFAQTTSYVNNAFTRPVFLLNVNLSNGSTVFAITTPLFNEPTCISSTTDIFKYVINQITAEMFFINSSREIFYFPGASCTAVIPFTLPVFNVLDLDVSSRSGQVYFSDASALYSAIAPTLTATTLQPPLVDVVLIALDYEHQYFYVVTQPLVGNPTIIVLDGFSADTGIISIRGSFPVSTSVVALSVDIQVGLAYALLSTGNVMVLENNKVVGIFPVVGYSVLSSLAVDPVSHCIFVGGVTTDGHPTITKFCAI